MYDAPLITSDKRYYLLRLPLNDADSGSFRQIAMITINVCTIFSLRPCLVHLFLFCQSVRLLQLIPLLDVILVVESSVSPVSREYHLLIKLQRSADMNSTFICHEFVPQFHYLYFPLFWVVSIVLESNYSARVQCLLEFHEVSRTFNIVLPKLFFLMSNDDVLHFLASFLISCSFSTPQLYFPFWSLLFSLTKVRN